ncbi:MAG TPA: type II toxin-antitoxin system RelE/ParE family toxin [Allosphingosinicella sp.]|nr:type II toxin-antitoxin system RelE/ParE family toxin [Allosphingosinicella sp.]
MLEVRKSALAKADLVDIWWHGFSQWGETQADRYLDRIEEDVDRLRQHPGLGVGVDDLCKGCRRWRSGVHRVYYVVEPQHLLIVRVLSARQDPVRHLEP